MINGYGMKFHATMLPNIVYAKDGRSWRFFDKDANGYSAVGPIYPTKELLIADMRRYLETSWGFEG